MGAGLRTNAKVVGFSTGPFGAPVLDPTKHGLGLSHVPTGFLAANRAYFLIAALAWNLKTWMLNLLQLGDGAVLRFKRFLYCGYAKRGWWQRLRGVLLKLPGVSTIRGSVKRSLGSLRSRSRRLLLLVSWHGEVRPECHRKSILPPQVDIIIESIRSNDVRDFHIGACSANSEILVTPLSDPPFIAYSGTCLLT